MSSIDFNIECLSCRDDADSPSGKLTSYFWKSNQSHKVDIFHLLKGHIRIFRDAFKTYKAVLEGFQERPSKGECSTGDQTRISGLQILLDHRSSRTIDQKLWWPTPITFASPLCSSEFIGGWLGSIWGLFSSFSQVVRWSGLGQDDGQHQVPTSTTLYWPSSIIYQLVPPYTGQVPPSTNQ